MTVEELVREVYDLLGEPVDIDPYQSDRTTIDTSSTGWTKILRALNQAVTAIATYKEPTRPYRHFRFRNYFNWQDVSYSATSDTLDSAISAGDFTAAFDASGTADALNGYALKVGSELRTIIDDDGAGNVTVNKAFSQAHASGAAISYAPRYLTITITGNRFFEVLRVYDYENERVLAPAERDESFLRLFNTYGEARKWFYRNGKIWLDTVQFDEQRYFRVEFYTLPETLTATSDTPALPENFHWAIVLWAAGWGFARTYGDEASKYSYRKEFEQFMVSRQLETDVADLRNQDLGGYVEMR